MILSFFFSLDNYKYRNHIASLSLLVKNIYMFHRESEFNLLKIISKIKT